MLPTSIKGKTMGKITKEEFIKRAILVHGDRYDYSKAVYIGYNKKLEIVCKKHGSFWQTPYIHTYRKSNCPICADNVNLTTEEFIKRAREKHGNLYDYSLAQYTNSHSCVKIVCRVHGVFSQKAYTHLQGGGCSKCNRYIRTLEEYFKEVKKKHKNLYSYPYIEKEYKSLNSKLTILCKKHGIFYQSAGAHLSGQRCTLCAKQSMSGNKIRKHKESFIKRAREVHGDLFDYSISNYVSSRESIDIICKIHGVFSQKAYTHLRGIGCPFCKSSKGEIRIDEFLKLKKAVYKRQYRIKECRNKKPLPFDFAVFEDEEKTKLKLLIEFDGKQHYEPIPIFGGTESLVSQQRKDKIKTDYCLKNSIKLIRIPYTEISKVEDILEDYIN